MREGSIASYRVGGYTFIWLYPSVFGGIDGFSIGSNDLTQLTLGVDRDSAELAGLFDERNDAVKWMIAPVIATAHDVGAKVGL